MKPMNTLGTQADLKHSISILQVSKQKCFGLIWIRTVTSMDRARFLTPGTVLWAHS